MQHIEYFFYTQKQKNSFSKQFNFKMIQLICALEGKWRGEGGQLELSVIQKEI